jgi:predicted N-acetyltransferase YhbS
MFPAEVKVGPQLLLRSLRDERDVSRFSAVLSEQLNAVEGLTANSLLRFHPERRLEEFQIVEDTATGEVVSTSCCFPWHLRFAGVDLQAVQLEMVLTHPRYRRRGLVHRQIERLHQIVEDRGYDLIILWGLPYYYRQFGYSYCLEGLAAQSLPAWRVPEGPGSEPARLRLRPAKPEDITLLAASYPRAVAGLEVYLDRGEAHWRYLLEAVKFPIYIVEEVKGGAGLGYVIQVCHKRMAHVFESSLPDQETGLALLQLLKRDHDEILVNWPAGGTLAKLAASLGSILTRTTQWEFRIPSLKRFLTKIAPVLERRLAGSTFRSISTDFVLNLFTEACLLRIVGGRIAEVRPLDHVDTFMGAEGGTLNIPPDAWMRLLFGDRGVDELHESWPDIIVKPQDRTLVNALFPRMEAYLYTPYHYYGPETFALEEKYLAFYL